MKTISVDKASGELIVATDNGNGTGTRVAVRAEQIPAHRRDKDFEAALQAAAIAVGAQPELVALAATAPPK